MDLREEAKRLFLEERLSPSEISKRLNIPKGTVRGWKCKEQWNTGTLERSKRNPRAIKAGTDPFQPQNQKAAIHGLFARYLPGETRDIIQQLQVRGPVDVLWDQIQLAYAALVRAQMIMFVKDHDDSTTTQIGYTKGKTSGETWEVQHAWDKQATFLQATARAQATLMNMIKQHDELQRSGLVTAEQEARIAKLKSDMAINERRIALDERKQANESGSGCDAEPVVYDVEDQIIPKLLPVLQDKQHAHIIITSGRAATKSSYAGIQEVDTVVSSANGSVVVLRKFHNKIRKTVYRETLRAINRLSIPKAKFKITVSPFEIRFNQTGNTIYFTGNDSIDDTKGMIDETRPIKLVVLDEVTEFFDSGDGEDELLNIEATFARGNDDMFQMLYLFNPPKNPNAPIMGWLEKMKQRPDVLHVHIDYQDVPESWLGAKLIEAAEQLKQSDIKMYNWIWRGQCIGIDELIYYMFSDRHVQAPPVDKENRPVVPDIVGIGVDYGQQNATTFQAFGVYQNLKRCAGLGEYYHSGRDSGHQRSPSEYAQDFVKFALQIEKEHGCIVQYAFIDPSAQGLAEEIKRAIPRIIIRDAQNSVALGISRVQKALTFGVMTINPSQKHLKKEFGLYSYDRKSIERGKEEPIKENDHCQDATRYCLMGLWKQIRHFLPYDDKEE